MPLRQPYVNRWRRFADFGKPKPFVWDDETLKILGDYYGRVLLWICAEQGIEPRELQRHTPLRSEIWQLASMSGTFGIPTLLKRWDVDTALQQAIRAVSAKRFRIEFNVADSIDYRTNTWQISYAIV